MAGTCPNCGTSLAVEMHYCPSCGQEQRERVVPVGQMLLDILRDNFAFDSKVFSSVPKLLFRPGFLTAEFVAGRRVRYIPAVRLYVFISVVAFLIVSIPTRDSFVQDGRLIDNEKPGAKISGMDAAMAEVGGPALPRCDLRAIWRDYRDLHASETHQTLVGSHSGP